VEHSLVRLLYRAWFLAFGAHGNAHATQSFDIPNCNDPRGRGGDTPPPRARDGPQLGVGGGGSDSGGAEEERRRGRGEIRDSAAVVAGGVRGEAADLRGDAVAARHGLAGELRSAGLALRGPGHGVARLRRVRSATGARR